LSTAREPASNLELLLDVDLGNKITNDQELDTKI
jgi:hypothetical protein